MTRTWVPISGRQANWLEKGMPRRSNTQGCSTMIRCRAVAVKSCI